MLLYIKIMDKSYILIDIKDAEEHIDIGEHKEEHIEEHIEENKEEHIDYEKIIQELKHKNKKIQDEKDKLEKRHVELLKLMNELLKINPSTTELDNLDDIRKTITQILYNEVRRHTIFPFSTLLGAGLGSYSHLMKHHEHEQHKVD